MPRRPESQSAVQSTPGRPGCGWRVTVTLASLTGVIAALNPATAPLSWWLTKQVSDQVTGTWTDPAKSSITFDTMAERWMSTKATRSPKTVAGYRSILDTIVLPRWRDIPLQDIRYDDLRQ